MQKLKEMTEQTKTHQLEFNFRETSNGFECQIYVNKLGLGKGEGKKKKDAKQLAAQETINLLQCDPDIQQKHKMFRNIDYVNQLYHYCQSNNIERVFYKEVQASKDYYIIECNCQGQIRTQGLGVAYQKAMNFAAFKMLQILESQVKIEQIEQSPIKIDLDNCAIIAINTLSLNSNDYQFFQDFLVFFNDIQIQPLGSFMTFSMRVDKPVLDLAIKIEQQGQFEQSLSKIKDIVQLELDGSQIKFGVKSTKNNKLKILVQENLMANVYFLNFDQLHHHKFMEPYYKICQWNRNASETLTIVHLWRQDSGLLIVNDVRKFNNIIFIQIFDFLVVCLTNGFQLNLKPIKLLRQLIFQLQHQILNDIDINPYITFQSQYHLNLIKQLGDKTYLTEVAQQWDINKISTWINRF